MGNHENDDAASAGSRRAGEGEEMPPRASPFVKRIEQHPIVKGIGLFVLLATFAALLWGGVQIFSEPESNSVGRHFGWRSIEYEKIEKLHAGQGVGYFTAILGDPIISKEIEVRGGPNFWQYGYRYAQGERDIYWIQAITQLGSPTVDQYTVTTCEPDFNPDFVYRGTDLTLGESSFREVTEIPLKSRYNTPGSDPGTYREWLSDGAGVDNYRYYSYGVAPTCYREGWIGDLGERDEFIGLVCGNFEKCASLNREAIQRFREGTVVNSWGECTFECVERFGIDTSSAIDAQGPFEGSADSRLTNG